MCLVWLHTILTLFPAQNTLAVCCLQCIVGLAHSGTLLYHFAHSCRCIFRTTEKYDAGSMHGVPMENAITLSLLVAECMEAPWNGDSSTES